MGLTEEQEKRVKALVKSGAIVDAVKYVQKLTKKGLRQSKAYVDSFRQKSRL